MLLVVINAYWSMSDDAMPALPNKKIAQRNGGDKHPMGSAGKFMAVPPTGLPGERAGVGGADVCRLRRIDPTRGMVVSLLRRFSEQSGEEAGEHFTPREVIRLMVELLEIPIPDRHCSIDDPASGTGGMLSVAKEHLLERADAPEENHQMLSNPPFGGTWGGKDGYEREARREKGTFYFSGCPVWMA